MEQFKFIISKQPEQTPSQFLSNFPPVDVKISEDTFVKQRPFTEIEAQQLLAVKSATGNPLFDITNKNEFYQLATLAAELRMLNPFDVVLAYYQKGWVARDLPFLSIFMTDNRIRVTLEEADILQKPIVEEGIYTCVGAQCTSKRIKRRQVQTRSADEPFTTFLTCTECGQRWRKG